MVLGNIRLLMVPYIKANGSTTKEKEREGLSTQTEMHFRDFSKDKAKKGVLSGINGTFRDN
jgi:hypothetical protein